MKNLIKINVVLVTAVAFCTATHAQQRASDKSFTTVLNEVKQQQTQRNRMLQQIRQATPVNSIPQNNTTIQAASNAATIDARRSITVGDATSQQGTNRQTVSRPARQVDRSGKQ